MQEDGKKQIWCSLSDKSKTSTREVVVMSVKSPVKMEFSAVTLSICLYLVPLTTHTGTLLSTLCRIFFPPSISANEFKD